MPVTVTRLRSSWVWLLAIYTLATFIETVFWGQLSAFTPLYLPRLGVDPADVARWTGLLAAVAGAAGLPFLPFWGALADRYFRQPIIVRSFVIYLLAGGLALVAGSIWVFALGRILMSLSLGNTGLMLTTLSERTPPNRQGLAFAIMTSASPIGAFIGPLVGGPVMDRWGFQTLLVINLLIMVGVVLLMAFGYSDSYRSNNKEPILKMAFGSVDLILRSARLRSLFAAFFFLYAGWMLALTYLPLVVTKLYVGDAPGSAVGLVLGGGGLLALVLGPLFGWMADRFGAWRILIGGAILAVVIWPLPAFTSGLLGFGIAWGLIAGLLSGVFSISFNVLSNSAQPEVRGRVMSFAYLPVNLGFFLGPAIGSVVTRSSLFAIFPTAAILTLVSLGLLAVARRAEI